MKIRKIFLALAIFTFAFFGGRGIALTSEEVYSRLKSSSFNSDSWGLCFREDGRQPEGNESSEKLAEYDTYFLGDEKTKVIYLTFDAGYENGNMNNILEALKKHNAKAVFFVVGSFMENNRDLLKRMDSEGHIIGNHSYSHPDMTKLDDKSFEFELQKNEDIYKEITGREMPKFYRPPQGKYSEYSLQMAKRLGYTTLFWSLAYVDWYDDNQPTKEQAFDKLLKRIHPGAVVLLHSTSKTNGEILDELLTKWEEMGYSFGDVSDFVTVQSKA